MNATGPMKALIPAIVIIAISATGAPALACNPAWGPCAGVIVTGPVGGGSDYARQSAQDNYQRGQQVQQWTEGNRRIMESWQQQLPRSGPYGQPYQQR